MCGLVGTVEVGERNASGETMARMLSVLRHRGPDDSGTYQSGSVSFGFRRLSILDLSPAGHQPMSTPDGMVTVVFNGEIYNFVELRRELKALGYQFRSSGDTEVLLYSYCEWGKECLAKMNGMWAFLIHDRRTGKIFGARDRFGIKPLYRYRSHDCVLFASEIKAILASGLCPRDINWPVAAAYLTHERLDETDETFITGVEKIPAGTAFEMEITNGACKQWRYWNVEDARWDSGGDPVEAFASLFEDVVRLHMRSDVPVAVHLSGGLDSTSILCASARIRRENGAADPLLAFSYMPSEFDESEYIRASIEHTGAKLVPLETSASALWKDLDDVLRFQDEPVHSPTALIGYQLMRVTAEHGIKVVLNGQGADETLAGYPSYFVNYWHDLMSQARFRTAWREMTAFAAGHNQSLKSLLLRQLALLTVLMLSRVPGYRLARSIARPLLARERGWYSDSIRAQAEPRSEVEDWGLDATLARSQERAPLPLYLRIEDRNSMAHSIEVRLPFLDFRLVSLAHSLASSWKLRGPYNKYVLREASRGRIPEVVRSRLDKMGFPTPTRKWLAGPLYDCAVQALDSRAARESGIYNVDKILSDLALHRRGSVDLGAKLFDVVQFEVWRLRAMTS